MGAIQQEQDVNQIGILKSAGVVLEGENRSKRQYDSRGGENALGFDPLASAALQRQPAAPQAQQSKLPLFATACRLYGRSPVQTTSRWRFIGRFDARPIRHTRMAAPRKPATTKVADENCNFCGIDGRSDLSHS